MTRATLSQNELDMLHGLVAAKRICPAWKGWLTPMFLGGTDGSNHSQTLRRLVRLGLVERKERGGCLRPSYLYRITATGRTALARSSA